jgi:hypothetical protein
VKHVQFVKPFTYADVVSIDMTDTYVTINASSQVEGYINDDIFTALDALGLVIDLDA